MLRISCFAAALLVSAAGTAALPQTQKLDEYLADLHETARRYCSNPLNDTPNDQIAPRFWEDAGIRGLPYDRGAMYFAALDGQIRKASGGRRSVDDLVIEMVERKRQGEATSEAARLELLTKALGEAGPAICRAPRRSRSTSGNGSPACPIAPARADLSPVTRAR